MLKRESLNRQGYSLSRGGVGGSGGMFPVPFTVGEKKFQNLVSITAFSRKGSP